jgi:hypothetical protein
VAKESGVLTAIDTSDAGEVSNLVGGLAGVGARAVSIPSEDDLADMTEAMRQVLESGVVIGEDGRQFLGKAGSGDGGEVEAYCRLVQAWGKRLGVDSKESLRCALSGVTVASDVLPEVERVFAQNGGEPSPELLGAVLSYAGKYHNRRPLGAEELHNRKMAGGGVSPVSLDAPLGDDNESNLYNVVGEQEAAGGYDFDPEEAAFEVGGGEVHWLDRAGHQEVGSPSFTASGESELFAPFSMARIADSLYRVVSTSGNEQQLRLLKDFASLQVDSIAGGGKPGEARNQIAAMLDMVDEQDQLEGEQGAVRRRFLSWVFSSVLNASGVDGQGFDRLGGIGATSLKKGLFEKLRRYGMPGVVVVEGAEVDKPAAVVDGLLRSKAWGYTSVGVCLPRSASEDVGGWLSGGGVGELVKAVKSAGVSQDELLQNISRTDLPSTMKQGLRTLVEGRGGPETGKAISYLQSLPDSEGQLLEVIKITNPQLQQKLSLSRMANSVGLEVKCLGDADNSEELADAARMDSVVFVPENSGKGLGQAIAAFGIKARVVQKTPVAALSEHVDYQSNPVDKDGKLDRNRLIKSTQVPLSRRLLLAAEACQESMEKGTGKGGY